MNARSRSTGSSVPSTLSVDNTIRHLTTSAATDAVFVDRELQLMRRQRKIKFLYSHQIGTLSSIQGINSLAIMYTEDYVQDIRRLVPTDTANVFINWLLDSEDVFYSAYSVSNSTKDDGNSHSGNTLSDDMLAILTQTGLLKERSHHHQTTHIHHGTARYSNDSSGSSSSSISSSSDRSYWLSHPLLPLLCKEITTCEAFIIKTVKKKTHMNRYGEMREEKVKSLLLENREKAGLKVFLPWDYLLYHLLATENVKRVSTADQTGYILRIVS